MNTLLVFQIQPEMAPQIRKTIGRDYVDLLVVPYYRNAIRDVVVGQGIKSLCEKQGRREIARQIRAFLMENLEPHGILIVDFLVRDVTLPERFEESIVVELTPGQRAELLSLGDSCR